MTRPTYCLTGAFDTGSSEDVAALLAQLNCRVLDEVSPKIDYLLIGRKRRASDSTEAIEAAIQLLMQGHQITLLHENHWLASLGSDPEKWQHVVMAKASVGEKVPRKPRRASGPPALWEGDHLVRFRYRNAKGEESEREVKLHRVSGANGRPADLTGYCLLRKMSRTFKAANILHAEVIDGETGEVTGLKELLSRL